MVDVTRYSSSGQEPSEGKYLRTKEYLVYAYLIDIAVRRTTAGYKDIAAIMGLPN